MRNIWVYVKRNEGGIHYVCEKVIWNHQGGIGSIYFSIKWRDFVIYAKQNRIQFGVFGSEIIHSSKPYSYQIAFLWSKKISNRTKYVDSEIYRIDMRGSYNILIPLKCILA